MMWPIIRSIYMFIVGGAIILFVAMIGVFEFRALNKFESLLAQDEEHKLLLSQVSKEQLGQLKQSKRSLSIQEIKQLKVGKYSSVVIISVIIAVVTSVLIIYWNDWDFTLKAIFTMIDVIFLVAVIIAVLDYNNKLAKNAMYELEGIVTKKEIRNGNHYIELNEEKELLISKKDYRQINYGDNLNANNLYADFKTPIKVVKKGSVLAKT